MQWRSRRARGGCHRSELVRVASSRCVLTLATLACFLRAPASLPTRVHVRAFRVATRCVRGAPCPLRSATVLSVRFSRVRRRRGVGPSPRSSRADAPGQASMEEQPRTQALKQGIDFRQRRSSASGDAQQQRRSTSARSSGLLIRRNRMFKRTARRNGSRRGTRSAAPALPPASSACPGRCIRPVEVRLSV